MKRRRFIPFACALWLASSSSAFAGVPVVDYVRNFMAEIHNSLQKAHWAVEIGKWEESIREYAKMVENGQNIYGEAMKIYKMSEKTVAVLTGERPWYHWRGTWLDKAGRRVMPATWGDVRALARHVGRGRDIAWDSTRSLGRIAEIMGETRERYGYRTVEEIFGEVPEEFEIQWANVLEDEIAATTSSAALGEVSYDRIDEQLALIEEDQAQARNTEDLKSSVDYLGYVANAQRMEALDTRRLLLAQLQLQTAENHRAALEAQHAHRLMQWEEGRGAEFLFDD